MMFPTLSAKLTGMKAKALAGTVIAGAALMMVAPAANAQRLAFGVTVGAPVYVAPAPAVVFTGPGYYDGVYVRDYNGWREHQTIVREHRFDGDRNSYRSNVDRDHHFDRDGHTYRR